MTEYTLAQWAAGYRAWKDDLAEWECNPYEYERPEFYLAPAPPPSLSSILKTYYLEPICGQLDRDVLMWQRLVTEY